jgi:ribonuclease Z
LGGPKFPIIINEIREPGVFYDNNKFKLVAANADHGLISYSYAFVELPRPGRFYPEKAKALGVPKGKLWHKLQHGETIMVNDKKIQSSQVTDPPRIGRKIVYSGDTRPNNNLFELSKEADLLIHESTFNNELNERAWNDGHSTTVQAAELALNARVSKLVLTHFSSRYYNTEDLCKEAKMIFSNTIAADDFLELEIAYRD